MTLELLKSKTGRTLIESHRGVEGCEVPENSWPAIEMGYQLSDVLSCANPVEARNILKHQLPNF